jgi:hypothetical protein
MTDDTVRFRADPNRLRAEGGENLDAIAMSLELDGEGVHLALRTGSFTERTIDVPYASVSATGYEEGLTYDLVFEADGTTYRVTNVTADESEMREMLEFVRERVRAARRVGGTAPASESGSASASNGGNTEPAADGAGEPQSQSQSQSRSRSGDRSAGGTSRTADDTSNPVEQLREWADLRDQGIISDEEFEAKKRELLNE